MADVEAMGGNSFRIFMLGGSNYKGEDVPNGQYWYGTAIALKRHNASLSVVLFPEVSSIRPIINHRYQNGWEGWVDFSGNTV